MQQVQDPPVSRKKLYEALNKQGKYTKSFQEFEQQFSNPESSQKLHAALSSDKSYTKDYGAFQSQFFGDLHKKKVDTSAPGPIPSPVTPEGSGSGSIAQFNATPTSKPLNPPDLRFAQSINEQIANQDKNPEQLRDEFQQAQTLEQGARDFITGVDRQQRPELHKETNPIYSFGKSIWNFMSNQLPSSLSSAAAALNQNMIMEDRLVGMRSTMTDKQREAYKEGAKEGKIALLKFADEQAQQGAKISQELVSSLSEADDPIDRLNWFSTILGQATGQIPLSMATRGVSSVTQEIGSIYLESVKKIASETGKTIDQVINEGLDSPAQAIAWGAAAGVLDHVGARGVLGSSRKAFASGLRNRVLEMAKAGAIEGGTEYTQTFFEQIGADNAAGKEFTDAFSEAFTSAKAQERLEALAAGAVSGPAISLGAQAVSGSNKSQQPAQGGESLTTNDAPGIGVTSTIVNETPEIVKDTEQNLDTSDQSVQNLQETEQPLEDVDQKSGAIVPRPAPTGIPATDPSVDDIKNTLIQGNKLAADDKGNITVKQNSGYPSLLFKELEQISGDKSTALNKYLQIKQDDGPFKQKYGDWENQIMKDYGRTGLEYNVKVGKPKNANPDAFVWVTQDDNGNPVISFNPEKVRREEDFDAVKKEYFDQVAKNEAGSPEQLKEYTDLYNITVTKLRDLKLHLIHEALIGKQSGEVTIEDKIRSLKEIQRLNGIELAKDYYGEPMIYMHSGPIGIQKFLKPGDKGYVQSDIMTGSAGIYFTRNPRSGKYYSEFGKNKNGEPAKGRDIYYTFLRAKNPYYMSDPRAQADYKLESSETISKRDMEALKKKGYDAVIWDKEGSPKHEAVVFEPDQIEIIGTYREGLKNEGNKPTSISEQPNTPTDRTGEGEVQAANQNQSSDQGVAGSIGEVTVDNVIINNGSPYQFATPEGMISTVAKHVPTDQSFGYDLFINKNPNDGLLYVVDGVTGLSLSDGGKSVKQAIGQFIDGEKWRRAYNDNNYTAHLINQYIDKGKITERYRSGKYSEVHPLSTPERIALIDELLPQLKADAEKANAEEVARSRAYLQMSNKKTFAEERYEALLKTKERIQNEQTQGSTQLRDTAQDQGEQVTDDTDAGRNDTAGGTGLESRQDGGEISATPNAPLQSGEGVQVEFDWLGQPKRGTIIKVDKDRLKIKTADGTTYTKKISDIKKVPAEVKAKAAKIAEKDAEITRSVKDLTGKLDEIVKKTRSPKKDQPGQANIKINPMFYLGQVDRTLMEKLLNVRKIEDYVSRVISKGLEHSNYFVRNTAGLLQNMIGGLAYTHSDLKNKLEYTGNKNYANVYAKALAEDLYKIIDGDHVSLERIHSVLDPEAFPLEENRMEFEEDYESGTAKAVMNPDLRYEDLNPQEQRLYDLIRLTNDFIHEWHHKQGLISDETYQEHKGKYIARLYEEYELTPPDVQEEFNKSRADFDMFKQRKDIEDIDKELLKDPVYATAKRVAQMMRNQAIFEYADAVNESNSITVSDAPLPNSTRLGTPGTKPFYGSLTGKYVPNYIAQDFRGMFFANKALEHLYAAFKGYDKNIARQVLKKSKTVYNPLVQLGNFLSNYSFSFWTGVDPLTFTKNMPRAGKEIKDQGRYYFDLLESGVLGTDLTIGDLKPVLDPGNPNAMLGKTQNAIKAAISGTKVGEVLVKFDDFASKLYSKTDDLSKMSAYISLREDYGYSKDEAIQAVYEGFQNYSTVGKAFDLAAKTPVVGNPYIKFKADLARIIKNAATRRPLTTAAYLMMLRLAAQMLSELSGEDEDVRRARERRPFIPKMHLPFADPIPLVWQVPGVGEVNVARFISPFYVYDKGDKNDIVNEVTDWLPYQFEMAGLSKSKDINVPIPEMADVFLGAYAQVALDRDFRGLSIRDPKGNEFITVATPDEQIVNSLNYIARSQVPMYRSASDMVSALMGEPDYYGRERTVSQAILNNIIKVQSFGPDQARDQLEKEIRYKVAKFDSYTRDIGMLKGVLKKDLQKIAELDLPPGRKAERYQAEVEKFKKRVAEKLAEQVEIVKSIEEPKELLKNLE